MLLQSSFKLGKKRDQLQATRKDQAGADNAEESPRDSSREAPAVPKKQKK